MNKSFYNTIGLQGQDLKKSEFKAGGQEARILEFFNEYSKGMSYTPFEVLKYVFSGNVPITSVRRALTNLTKGGYLEKLEDKTMGEYGQLNHRWKLKDQSQQIKFL